MGFLKDKYQEMSEEYPNFKTTFSLLLISAIIVIFLAFYTDTFLTAGNLNNVMVSASVYVLMVVGLTFVFTTAGLDISTGAIIGVSGIMAGYSIIEWGYSMGAGIAIALLTGIVLGAINGIIIVKFKVPPVVCTIGTLAVYRGFAYVISGGELVYGFPDAYNWFSRGTIIGIPIPVWTSIIVTVIGYYVLNKTRLGRHITATGGNLEAAILAGINTGKLKFLTYVITGFLCGLGGILLTARLDSAAPGLGDGYEIHAIASVVLGGTSLFGGKGLIVNSVVAVLLLQIVHNSMVLIGVPFFWQEVVVGSLYVAVVAARTVREREGEAA